MYYEINIAQGNQGHYFATAEHSITHKEKAFRLAKELSTLYPKSKGFRITIRRITRGEELIPFDPEEQVGGAE